MQDIHSNAGGRISSGGSGGSMDKRLQSSHHQLSQHQQALKCPRCESLDTKFCYYNNYNLSQPRHFCKSCRRYWTKGGVLRNVPVGGGCRKAKRSKSKSSAPVDLAQVSAESESTTRTTMTDGRDRETSCSHSSSERSSSLTAATTSSAEAAGAVSATPPSRKLSTVLDINESKSIIMQSVNAPPVNTGFNQHLLEQSPGCALFSGAIRSSADPLPLGSSSGLAQSSQCDWSDQRWDEGQMTHQEGQMPSSDGCASLDQTVQVDLPALQGRQAGDEELVAFDWQPMTDEGRLFDEAYWSYDSQWADEDDQPSPFLP
ncbi:hypothetical protein SAY87_003077 [Trapa incisa]|uniref:Dof zinc finger protein n=1 Tax=Trapa incisa TaxID=236973 RepID=A0AAN7KIQ7_9MYRT|nr:hypothetical protein SAY87_003077 [Trapa incisa]